MILKIIFLIGKYKKIKNSLSATTYAKKKKNENKNDYNYNENFDLQSYEDITYSEITGLLNPNEPIYCFCNYVSYGNMVRCDNTNVIYKFSSFLFYLQCPKEWFHFNCVGLKNLPKGKWFCGTKCSNMANPKVKKYNKKSK